MGELEASSAATRSRRAGLDCPRIVTGARLIRRTCARAMLLVPEVVRLNPTAAAVLELCDGERSLDDIVGTLSARYEGSDLRNDVQGLVDGMTQRGLVVDAAI